MHDMTYCIMTCIPDSPSFHICNVVRHLCLRIVQSGLPIRFSLKIEYIVNTHVHVSVCMYSICVLYPMLSDCPVCITLYPLYSWSACHQMVNREFRFNIGLLVYNTKGLTDHGGLPCHLHIKNVILLIAYIPLSDI
jgi:hypothetical protein